MFCPECGKQNKDNARFCRFCGTRIEEEAEVQTGGRKKLGDNDKQNQPAKKKIRKIWIALAAVLILGIVTAIVIFALILPQQKEKNYRANVADGERYLEEMDYEKAEDSYLAAIEIDPKEPEPYLQLVDIYESQNQPEKVVDILKRGAENTNSSEIREKYDLYTYVEDVLIPEEGGVEEGTFTCKYINQPQGDSFWTGLDPVHSEKGILTSRIRDFDDDKKDELLVLSLNNEARENEYTRVDQNEVVLRMYEYLDGEVVLSDEMSALCPVLGDGDLESSGIFLHEYAGQIYICGSFRQHFNIISDGIKFNSFVTVYNDGEGFKKQAGTDETVIGSEFSGEKSAAEEMAEYLAKIGLPAESEQIRESWLRCFEFADDVEILMLITGENNIQGYPAGYWETMDTSELGEVVLTLKLTWDEKQKVEEDRELGENNNETEQPEASYQLDDEGIVYATQKFLDGKNFQNLDESLEYKVAKSGRLSRYNEAYWVPILEGEEENPSYYAIVASGAFENPGEAEIYSSDVIAVVEGTATMSEFEPIEEFNVNQFF